jgi:membrane-associated phospholipid phosphatase
MDPCRPPEKPYCCRPLEDPYQEPNDTPPWQVWPPRSLGNDPLHRPPPPEEYRLRGPQVEPAASYWLLCPAPCVPSLQQITEVTDRRKRDGKLNACYFPPYPGEKVDEDGNDYEEMSEEEIEEVTRQEIAELKDLACLRDDPEAIFSNEQGRERKGLSLFLRLRPQPLGAVVNTLRRGDSLLVNGGPELRRAAIDVCAQPRPDMGPVPCVTGCADEFFPAVRTGRELARYFESETPGLAHRLALNYLIREANYSPPYQAFIWAALDVAIYSALSAAWYYKWLADADCHLSERCRPSRYPRRGRTSRRPRPYEVDYEVDVLFNRKVNCTNSADGERRLLPDPSPGTPRHPSYPSGHSTYSGAASEILSYFFPDYAGEFSKLADNTGMARLWAGIHYRSDHIQGMKLGRCVARLIIRQIEESCIVRPDPCDQGECSARPPSNDDLCRCAERFCKCCHDRGHENGHEYDRGHRTAQAEQAPRQAGQARRKTRRGPGEGGAAPAGEGREREGGAQASSEDLREQARGPQEGAGVAGSSEEQREQAQGPQEGGRTAGSAARAKEQAKGPQEGAK